MLRKLILLRHAEASSDAARDFDRSLTPSGQRAVRYLGRLFNDQGLEVEKIISSNAVRALSTAEILSEEMGVSVREEGDLYEASVRIFLRLVNDTTPELRSCIFVGHNPTISYLAEYLTGESLNMEPAGAALIDLEMPWLEVGERSGSLRQYFSPSVYAP